MSATSATVGKHYERLTHRERLRMLVEARAREDSGEVDCLWRAQRVALELDGRAVHGSRAAFERDRVRDRALAVAGWTSANASGASAWRLAIRRVCVPDWYCARTRPVVRYSGNCSSAASAGGS